MNCPDDFDRSLARWFESEARPTATADVLDRALRATRRRRPRPRLFAALGSDWVGDSVGSTSSPVMFERTRVRTSMALLLLLLALVLVAAAVLVGAGRLKPAPVDLGIFEPIAGKIVYGDEQGIWGVDPAAPADPATRVPLTSEAGIPLGWSSDGTQLLIRRGSNPEAHLFVLHADGSEVQVTEGPMSIAGATISPDGSRVAFAGATSGTGSALYAVDADGGSATVLVGPQGGVIREPTYSPDGTRIAYTFGGGDHSHHVWVVRADGSEAHEIVYNERTAAAGHVHGLAWSPAGDRLALALEGTIYTFAADGSDFRQIAGGETTCDPADPCAVKLPKSAESPYWSPDGAQIAYTTGCVGGAGAANRAGCNLAIADADGSNVRELGVAASGPWHPAPIASDTPSPVSSEPGQLVLNLRTWTADPDPAFVEVAVYADGRVIWVADERVGFVAQRLTAGGVERLRSRVLSAGLFDGDLALGIDGVGWGNVTVDRGDRSVIVAWGSSPVNVSGLGLEAPFVRATSAQSAEVIELEAFLRDPVTWEFPDDVYVQREVTPYVSSHLWVGYDRSAPILSNLPSPAREILTSVLRPPVRPDCELISIAEAQEIALALAGAGILEPDNEVRRGFAFDEPGSRSFVHLHPALPHDVAACREG
jgi:dipeptidyl aminopeptidase/acylaminoacyl peptidase